MQRADVCVSPQAVLSPRFVKGLRVIAEAKGRTYVMISTVPHRTQPLPLGERTRKDLDSSHLAASSKESGQEMVQPG